MEPFIIGTGIGCLIGVAAAYLIVGRPKGDQPPTWLQLLDEQEEAFDDLRLANHRGPQYRAITRLTNRKGTVEI